MADLGSPEVRVVEAKMRTTSKIILSRHLINDNKIEVWAFFKIKVNVIFSVDILYIGHFKKK